jgi:hypothetical protein
MLFPFPEVFSGETLPYGGDGVTRASDRRFHTGTTTKPGGKTLLTLL